MAVLSESKKTVGSKYDLQKFKIFLYLNNISSGFPLKTFNHSIKLLSSYYLFINSQIFCFISPYSMGISIVSVRIIVNVFLLG